MTPDSTPEQPSNFSWDLSQEDLSAIRDMLPQFDPQPNERIPNTGNTLLEVLRGGTKFKHMDLDDQEYERTLRRTSVEGDLQVGSIVKNLLDSLPEELSNISEYFAALPAVTGRAERNLREIRDSFVTVGDYGAQLSGRGMCPETILEVFVGLELLGSYLSSETSRSGQPRERIIAAGDIQGFLKDQPLSEQTTLSPEEMADLIKSEIRRSIANEFVFTDHLDQAADLLYSWTKRVVQSGVPIPTGRNRG